uniref:NFATC2-interacting protein n=1 Tax=Laticauda laticaudata TaxID=8630 RepID=A0A8C5WQD5_LATLA
MNHYKEAQGLSRSKVVFYFDGQRLTETLTPEQLGMESGDVIEIRERTGAYPKYKVL